MASSDRAVLWSSNTGALCGELCSAVAEHANAISVFVDSIRGIAFREETFLDTDDLLYRGWTAQMIDDLLRETDADGQRYYEQRIHAVEASEAFQHDVRAAAAGDEIEDVIAAEMLVRSQDMREARATWPLPVLGPAPELARPVDPSAHWRAAAPEARFLFSALWYDREYEDWHAEGVYFQRAHDHDIIYIDNKDYLNVKDRSSGSESQAIGSMMPRVVEALAACDGWRGFGTAGSVTEADFNRWIDEAARQRQATLTANEANRHLYVVCLAESLGLHPKPSDQMANCWLAECPDAKGYLTLDTGLSTFDCTTCIRSGDGAALREWAAESLARRAATQAAYQERKDARRLANEAQRGSPVVRLAIRLGLAPEPADDVDDTWYATCPGGDHLLHLNAVSGRFVCRHCHKDGRTGALRGWTEQQRARRSRAVAMGDEREAAAQAMRHANEADRGAAMVQLAMRLGLAPEPSDKTAGLWLAPCPAGGHELELRPQAGLFDCSHCRRRGGPIALERFAGERIGCAPNCLGDGP